MLTTVVEGNVVSLRVRFSRGRLIMLPDAVTFLVTLRGSAGPPVVLAAAPEADLTGYWHAEFKPEAPGVWLVRAEAVNPDGAVEGAVTVTARSVPAP